MPSLEVMISHAGEDRIIAKAWKSLLGTLYGSTKGIWYSNDPAGAFDGLKPFAVQIVDNILAASVVLTIQTARSVNKPWVIWEAGVATGAKKPTFIVTYNLTHGGLGNSLDGMDQRDGLDRESVSVLCTSIGRTAQQDPFPASTFTEAWTTYINQVTSTDADTSILPPAQYDKGIALRIKNSAVHSQYPKTILDEAYVFSDNGGLSLFGWDVAKSSVKWSDFYNDLRVQDQKRKWPGSALGWADVLDDMVQLVLKDKLGNAESLPLYLDEQRNIAYRPSISLRRQKGQFVEILVKFNQLPDEMSKRPSGRYGVLSNIMDFCRMFRWGILESNRYKDLFTNVLTDSDAAEAFAEFKRAATNIRIDLQNRGLERDALVEAFPENTRPRIAFLLWAYYEMVEKLNAMEAPSDPIEMRKYYDIMLDTNKDVYLNAFNAYRPCIEHLDGRVSNKEA